MGSLGGVERREVLSAFKGDDVFYPIDRRDSGVGASEEAAAFIRRKLSRMGDDVVENALRDGQIRHVPSRSCR